MKLMKKIKYCLAAVFALPAYIAGFRNGGERLQEDMAVWTKKTNCPFQSRFRAFVFLMLNYPPFRNIVYYRINSYKSHGGRRFYGWWLLPAQKDIYIECEDIAGGFYISHGFSTVIYARYIGTNFHAFQSITVGQKNGEIPTIGNNVTIYTGAKIIGDVVIGDNVEIGANAVVLHDVPSNHIAVGVPAILKAKQPQNAVVEKPLVSVIVVTYNQADWIEETLEALCKQTYPNLEFILSDDCSSDDTWEKILHFEAKLSDKGKVVLNRQNKNMGITANYNKAFSLCSGKIIVINEGDDISMPNRISTLVEAFSDLSHPILIQSGYDLLVNGQTVDNQCNTENVGGG